jgi:hypothetical protein
VEEEGVVVASRDEGGEVFAGLRGRVSGVVKEVEWEENVPLVRGYGRVLLQLCPVACISIYMQDKS